MLYLEGQTPEEAHETWKRQWAPPKHLPFAMKGRAVVEFGPHAAKGSIWTPELPSHSAIMIDDSGGDVPTGTQIAVGGGVDHVEFQHEGRTLHVIPRADILLMEVAA